MDGCLHPVVVIRSAPMLLSLLWHVPYPSCNSTGCHDLALRSIVGSVEAFTGVPSMFTSMSACDIDTDCRIVLANHVADIHHVFGDIQSKLLVAVAAQLDAADLGLDRQMLARLARFQRCQTPVGFHSCNSLAFGRDAHVYMRIMQHACGPRFTRLPPG